MALLLPVLIVSPDLPLGISRYSGADYTIPGSTQSADISPVTEFKIQIKKLYSTMEPTVETRLSRNSPSMTTA